MKDNMIEENLKLAFSFAHNFNKTHDCQSKYDYEDIISDCLLGLVKAAKNFDPNIGISFSTFAHICMKNEIMMHLRQKKRQTDHTFTLDLFDKDGNKIEDITLILAYGSVSEEEEKLIDVLWLQEAMLHLTDLEREVINLYYFKDTKICYIANMLGFTESYISKVHSKALQKLRKNVG